MQEAIHTTKNVTLGNTSSALSKYDQFIKDSEFNRYGLMVVFILATCCLGGVAYWAMGINFNVPVLSLLLSCTLIPMALMLAVTPMKVIIPSVVASLLVSTIVILSYLVF